MDETYGEYITRPTRTGPCEVCKTGDRLEMAWTMHHNLATCRHCGALYWIHPKTLERHAHRFGAQPKDIYPVKLDYSSWFEAKHNLLQEAI